MCLRRYGTPFPGILLRNSLKQDEAVNVENGHLVIEIHSDADRGCLELLRPRVLNCDFCGLTVCSSSTETTVYNYEHV